MRICTVLVILLFGTFARAEPAPYIVIVGNNAPPKNSETELPTLRFADDDAVRYYDFFKRFAEEIRLLTVLDAESEKRYPEVSSRALLPTKENLLQVIGEFDAKMRLDEKKGKEPVFYFVFSGHGAVDTNGTPFLSLLDGGISRDLLYDEIIGRLPAQYHHVIVDSCRAEAVVGIRGMFDKEVDAVETSVTTNEVKQIVGDVDPHRYPGLGVIIATTRNQEAHEWSRIQSGVFTHELLSGLKGAADVNGDGRIEYSEIQAFVASANRTIPDPRAVPNIIAQPPTRNRRVSLISLESLTNVGTLEGDPHRLGHFYIELENGERYLDANLGDMVSTTIAFPMGRLAFLRTQTLEAELDFRKEHKLRFSDLKLSRREATARGSLDHAYRTALFNSPYGSDYYKGFVDSIGAVPVVFTQPARFRTEANTKDVGIATYRKPLALTSLTLAGASFAAFIVTGALALDARRDVQNTDLQRTAHDANKRYESFGIAAITTGAFAIAAGITSWLLWPKRKKNRDVE